MNRQYWRPWLHYTYLLYILYSLMYLVSSFWCISIRKPSVLQTQEPPSSKWRGVMCGGKKNHTTSSSARVVLPLAAGYTALPGSLLVLGLFSASVASQTLSQKYHRAAQAKATGMAESPGRGRHRGQQPLKHQPALKPAQPSPQNPTLAACIL